MNFVGIVALILGLIGAIITGIGLYYMYQDVNSTSTRSTFWTATGAGILLLTIILMIMAVIFKGNDQKKAKEKVDQRVKVVKRAVIANDIREANQANQPPQQVVVQNPNMVQRNECGDIIPDCNPQYAQPQYYTQQYQQPQYAVQYAQPQYVQQPREIVYISPDLVSQQQPIVIQQEAKVDRKQDKEIKRITESLEVLGRKLEGNQVAVREKEMAKNFKVQQQARDAQIEQLRNELQTVKQEKNVKKEEKALERKIEKRMEKRGLIPPPNSVAIGNEFVARRNLPHVGQAMYQTAAQPLPYQGAGVPAQPNFQMYQTPYPVMPYQGNLAAVPVQQQYALADVLAAGIPAFQQQMMNPEFIGANVAAMNNAAGAVGGLANAFGQGVQAARRAQPVTASPFQQQQQQNVSAATSVPIITEMSTPSPPQQKYGQQQFTPQQQFAAQQIQPMYAEKQAFPQASPAVLPQQRITPMIENVQQQPQMMPLNQSAQPQLARSNRVSTEQKKMSMKSPFTS